MKFFSVLFCLFFYIHHLCVSWIWNTCGKPTNLPVLDHHTRVCVCACVNSLYACSLLAQVSGHIAAFEALEVIEALGQPLRSLTVSSAAIGQSIRAPVFQTAQITLL